MLAGMRKLASLLTLVSLSCIGGLSTYAWAKAAAFPACCDYVGGGTPGGACAACHTPACCVAACNACCTRYADNINCRAGC